MGLYRVVHRPVTRGELAVLELPSAVATFARARGYLPTGVYLFPNDLLMPAPRSWVERSCNVTHYRLADAGGHFPALENGKLLTADMRAFFAKYR